MFKSRWTRTRRTRQIFSKFVKTEKPNPRTKKQSPARREARTAEAKG